MPWALVGTPTSAGGASGGALSINKPTGAVDGHLAIVAAYLEDDTNTWASTNGFALLKEQLNAGAFSLRLYYKWCSGEPSSWTFTPTSTAWRTLVCAVFSGGSGSGDPLDVSSGAQGDGVSPVTSQTAPGITTAVDEDLVVWAYGNFSGTNVTAMTGFATNLRVSFNGLTLADAVQTVAGATGTSAPSTGPGTEDYAAIHAGLLINSGSPPVAQEQTFVSLGFDG